MSQDLETAVPADDSPTQCRFCDRPFSSDTYRTLHEGIAHYDSLGTADREAFADAYEAEQEALRLFRLKALAALIVLYFGFLWAYSIFG